MRSAAETGRRADRREARESVERLGRMEAILDAHMEADRVAFQSITRTLDKIDANVESLLASRTFLRGAWRAVVVVAAGVSAVVGALMAWLRQ